jgi:hypothetical protein
MSCLPFSVYWSSTSSLQQADTPHHTTAVGPGHSKRTAASEEDADVRKRDWHTQRQYVAQASTF